MFEWTLPHIVFILGAGALTLIAAYTDQFLWKIPNKLTIPAFCLGLVYQTAFYKGEGLLDGLAGFGLGFGMYFLLFAIAGGGAGDVKLMGALGAWLGFRMTLLVIIGSTAIVALALVWASIRVILTQGVRQWQKQYMSSVKKRQMADEPDETKTDKSAKDSKKRPHHMAFAIPVGVATWALMILNGMGIIKDRPLGPPRNAQAKQNHNKPVAPQG